MSDEKSLAIIAKLMNQNNLLIEQIKILTAEADELYDDRLRLMAELDGLRKENQLLREGNI